MAVYPAGAYVAANSEYLSRASEVGLQAGDIDFSLVAWVYLLETTSTRMIIGKDHSTSGYREYNLQFTTGANIGFRMEVFRATDTAVVVRDTVHGTPTVNAWHMVVATHNAATDTGTISTDVGTPVTAAIGGALQAASAAEFRIGARQYTGFINYHNGRIGPVGYAKGYVLSAADITELYNGGNGRLWAQLSSGLKAKFGSCWWDMTETSGTRASWDGNMNLTDNNTVMSADGPILVPTGAPWQRRPLTGGMMDLAGGMRG